ncbi:MAG: protein kinase [Armatimonadetes bacterium]|nr:protein kinase [Armatimonadota bacterium]
MAGAGPAHPPCQLLDERYEITSLIKRGGMSVVHKGYDRRLKRICAVKEMAPFFSTTRDQAYARKRFEEEALILARLRHENLPIIYDYFVEGTGYYLVMEFIDGEDLETLLHKNKDRGFAEGKVVSWAGQILPVLEYLHGLTPPIIYRDLKPSNIMLREDGLVVLVDFGIAKTLITGGSVPCTLVGSEGYAPPEQYQGKAFPQSDLYALGATMYSLLSGQRPIPFGFQPLRTVVPMASDRMERIVAKALRREVNERFSTAREMLDALASVNSTSREDEGKSLYVFRMKVGGPGQGRTQFCGPQGIAVGPDGNVYVADPGNRRILKLGPQGALLKSWSHELHGEGDPDFFSGLASDPTGNIYVADTFGDRILKFDPQGGLLLEWGTFGSENGKFLRPCGVASDRNGNIHVADCGNQRIQVFDESGKFLHTFGSYGSDAGRFQHPTGIALGPDGSIYVSDGTRNRVQKFDPNGGFIKKWGVKGSQEGEFCGIRGIAADFAGRVHVADSGNNRIQSFGADGDFLSEFGSYGSADGRFKDPTGIAVDSSWTLFVVDTGNNRIQAFAFSYRGGSSK